MERIVAYEGSAGTGEKAEFCSLAEAKKFINSYRNARNARNARLITKRENKSKKFRDDNNEGHRYCICSSE